MAEPSPGSTVKGYLVRFKVPCKNSGVCDTWVVNWPTLETWRTTEPTGRRIADVVRASRLKLVELYSKCPQDQKDAAKFRNTVMFLDQIQE